jgi:hypothetical protein
VKDRAFCFTLTRTMIRNKHSVLCYLLLAYFVVYAISPLSYTYTAGKLVDKICGTNGSLASAENFNIFLLEVICAKIDAKNDADQSDSTVMVLIRKARAILPENTNLRSIPLDSVTISEYVTSRFSNSLSKIAAHSSEQHSICEFNPLHSGPAPPSL